jgi:hypothetical protein
MHTSRPRPMFWGSVSLFYNHHENMLGQHSPVSGSSSAVERQLPKLDVAGSIPVSRSILQHLTMSFLTMSFIG